MGRFMRWLKQLLTGRKEEHRGHVAGDWSDGPERKRWSFVKQRKSAADGGARPSGQAAPAAAAAGSPSLRLRTREDARASEEKAAIVIQKTFRGYLARRALRALRSLVKIQALVRGYLVRKQAAMTLHRLQTLMRLQADSIAVKKASYRKSMEQEEMMYAREVRVKPPPTPAHRRRLSDSTDSNYERSPRIVEMDTCRLRSRSSRITGRYTHDHSSEYRIPAPTPSCSPLPGGKQQQPARLSLRRSGRERERERDARGSKTAQSTPRFPSSRDASPGKSVEHSLASTPRRSTQRDRDALVSPRYMAGTASSAARTRCHSAPRQRQSLDTELAPRTSLTRAGTSRRPCSQAHGGGGFCAQCSSDANRTGSRRFSELGISDEAAARDYYLDSMW